MCCVSYLYFMLLLTLEHLAFFSFSTHKIFMFSFIMKSYANNQPIIYYSWYANPLCSSVHDILVKRIVPSQINITWFYKPTFGFYLIIFAFIVNEKETVNWIERIDVNIIRSLLYRRYKIKDNASIPKKWYSYSKYDFK